jgi:hypothetical protein
MGLRFESALINFFRLKDGEADISGWCIHEGELA